MLVSLLCARARKRKNSELRRLAVVRCNCDATWLTAMLMMLSLLLMMLPLAVRLGSDVFNDNRNDKESTTKTAVSPTGVDLLHDIPPMQRMAAAVVALAAVGLVSATPTTSVAPVSYTHLTLPTNREV